MKLGRIWFKPSEIFKNGVWMGTASDEVLGEYDLAEEATVSRRTARRRMIKRATEYFNRRKHA